MAHKRDPNLPVVGEDSLCVGCKHSRVVTVRAEPHPSQVHAYRQEHPEREPPPGIYHVESMCVHRDFIGSTAGGGCMPARSMGTVVECELYIGREIATTED